MKLLDFAKGKKTYITVAVGLAIGVYAALTGHDIPVWAYALLGFAGLGFQRSALSNQAQIATTGVLSLVQAVLSRVAIPDRVDGTNLPVTLPESHRANGEETTQTIVIGQPTPTSIPEIEATKALNKAQLV